MNQEDDYNLGYAHAVARVRDATGVLLAHTRSRIQDCHCGWSELGHSHAEHVLSALADYLEDKANEPAQ